MSAMNVCFKDDRAIIMQDAAAYAPDGRVVEFVDKGAAMPEIGCYVACTGAAVASTVFAKLLPKIFKDIDDIGDEGEPLLGKLYDEVADLLERYGSRELTAIIAGWSAQHDRPRIVAFSRGIDGDVFAGDIGYNVHPALEGPAQAAWLRHHGKAFDIGRFDPLTDGIKLLELQRRMPQHREGRPTAYLIGGHVTLTEVRKDSITTRTVHEWPEDVAGDLIRPKALLDPVAHPNVSPIAGKSRAERRRLAKQGRAA